jgi:hypothetical protein
MYVQCDEKQMVAFKKKVLTKNDLFFSVTFIKYTIYQQSGTGLPDDIFSYKKSQFVYILEGLGMEYVGIVYGHL